VTPTNTILQLSAPYTDPERLKTTSHMIVRKSCIKSFEKKQASKADFRLKL